MDSLSLQGSEETNHLEPGVLTPSIALANLTEDASENFQSAEEVPLALEARSVKF